MNDLSIDQTEAITYLEFLTNVDHHRLLHHHHHQRPLHRLRPNLNLPRPPLLHQIEAQTVQNNVLVDNNHLKFKLDGNCQKCATSFVNNNVLK